jgi:hypothetical protein
MNVCDHGLRSPGRPSASLPGHGDEPRGPFRARCGHFRTSAKALGSGCSAHSSQRGEYSHSCRGVSTKRHAGEGACGYRLRGAFDGAGGRGYGHPGMRSVSRLTACDNPLRHSELAGPWFVPGVVLQEIAAGHGAQVPPKCCWLSGQHKGMSVRLRLVRGGFHGLDRGPWPSLGPLIAPLRPRSRHRLQRPRRARRAFVQSVVVAGGPRHDGRAERERRAWQGQDEQHSPRHPPALARVFCSPGPPFFCVPRPSRARPLPTRACGRAGVRTSLRFSARICLRACP